MKSIAFVKFAPVDLVQTGSWGERAVGAHASTMELFQREDGSLMIEWDIPSIEETEHIGLVFDGKTLVGYDGVVSLPKQAADFLRSRGYAISSELSGEVDGPIGEVLSGGVHMYNEDKDGRPLPAPQQFSDGLEAGVNARMRQLSDALATGAVIRKS
jgi:hypothetical protein